MAGLIKGVMDKFADNQFAFAPLNEEWAEVLLHGDLRVDIRHCRDLANADSGIVGRLTGDTSDQYVMVCIEGVRVYRTQKVPGGAGGQRGSGSGCW